MGICQTHCRVDVDRHMSEQTLQGRCLWAHVRQYRVDVDGHICQTNTTGWMLMGACQTDTT